MTNATNSLLRPEKKVWYICTCSDHVFHLRFTQTWDTKAEADEVCKRLIAEGGLDEGATVGYNFTYDLAPATGVEPWDDGDGWPTINMRECAAGA